LRSEMMTGMLPMMSITANKTIVTLSISEKLTTMQR